MVQPFPGAPPARSGAKRSNLVIGLVVALVFAPAAMVIVIAVAILLMSLQSNAPAVARLDLMSVGRTAAFDAQAGQRILFRADVELDPRLGDSKASRNRVSSDLHASKIQVTIIDPGGRERTQSCPLSGSGGMFSTGFRFYFSNVGLGCSFPAEQAGQHRVRAEPSWRSLTPRGATLAVVLSDDRR